MTPRLDRRRTLWAILAIIASVFALSLGDAVIKQTGIALPLWQMYILRSALVVPVLWALARRQGPLWPAAPAWVGLRSLLLITMWLSYYLALPHMPLSLAAAAYYTGPLFIVAFAAALARCWPTPRALIAIAGGFLGVVLILRPETAGFQVIALLPVFAAVLYACAMLLTAAKCQGESPLVLALALNIGFVIAGVGLGLAAGRDGSFMLGPWQPLDSHLMITIAALAACLLIGSVGAAFAYQNGPPATIAVFDYSYLVFSLLWGAVLFAESPGHIALLGILTIFAAGLLALPRRG
ncbi:DMT family transporter [Roseobacter sp. A03A-229]